MTRVRRKGAWETGSAEATFALGEALGGLLPGGLTVGLSGPLGAGKTQLVKGIASGNAVDDVRRVTSPTFTLVHEYSGRLTLYHVDAYRLSGSREALAIGFDELIRPDSAVVVEWADRMRPVIPVEALWVLMSITADTGRRLDFDATGDAAVGCLERLQALDR